MWLPISREWADAASSAQIRSVPTDLGEVKLTIPQLKDALFLPRDAATLFFFTEVPSAI